MKITFLGATQTVTGSKYLVYTEDKEWLIDCGLFQGHKELRLRNWAPLPLPARDIDGVILTHAHIDHSGYLPRLIKQGFRGPVFSTPGTRDLCSILLPDSGYLQEEEARLANKKGFSKHKPALPLYTREEAETVLSQFQAVPADTDYALDRHTTFRLNLVGHILGASAVLLTHRTHQHERSILFSGDLGRTRHPLMYPPTPIAGADYLVLESTYGNRRHERMKPLVQLADIINHTAARGGCVLVPAFAVGRTQTLLLDLYKLKTRGEIPDIPVYLDSPLATRATQIFCQHADVHRLAPIERCEEIFSVAQCVEDVEASRAIDHLSQPAVIISASGMATGGRILHHLKAFAPDARNTILFTGYQALGTRGARIVYGEDEVKIHGEMVPIRAEVQMLHNTSAHADADEILNWISHFTHPPKTVFITHGEPAATTALKKKIERQLHWHCVIPEYLQTVSLSS